MHSMQRRDPPGSIVSQSLSLPWPANGLLDIGSLVHQPFQSLPLSAITATFQDSWPIELQLLDLRPPCSRGYITQAPGPDTQPQSLLVVLP